jgi:hypothetical protein
LSILPVAEDSEEKDKREIHTLYPPVDEDSPIRIKTCPPGGNARIFDAGDLDSLQTALTYGQTYAHARSRAVSTIAEVVEFYCSNIKCPPAYDLVATHEDYRTIRMEVYELIRNCSLQEKAILDQAYEVLHREIASLQAQGRDN